MDYITVDADEQERLAFEVVGSLAVDQFEAALQDETVLLDEEQLRNHLHVLEQDHVRQSVRARVAPAAPLPGTLASTEAQVEDLERRIEAVKERLGLAE